MKLKVVSIGGFGHSVCVFDEMLGMKEAELYALAPAYKGEDIDTFTEHELCKGKRIFDDYREMLNAVNPDVAIIGTRLDNIPEIAIEVANTGCHLICEKPLALDINKLEDVYDAVSKNSVKLVAMLSMRSEAHLIAARNVYASGDIGQAVMVNARKSYKWGVRPEWFGERKYYGGTIGWVGIHAMDMINFVTGLKFKKVAAMQENFAHSEYKACEDNCALALQLSNGGHATISLDYFRPENAKTWGDDWVRVVGTKGVIEASGTKGTCSVLVNDKDSYEVALPEKNRIFWEFMVSIINGGQAELKQAESFILTHASLCARQAADTQSFVEIEYGKWT